MKVPANFRYTGFYDLLCDAVYQHRLASECTDSYLMNRHARASISASLLTLECGANCLIGFLDISSGLLKDIDKLPLVAKYETYLRFRNIETFDRGRNEVEKIVELVRARNDFVHPKAANIKTDVGELENQGKFVAMPAEFHGETWKAIGIPKRALFWNADSALTVLKAVVAFFSYLFLETMESDVEEVQYFLLSRLELGNVHAPSQFLEFETELKAAIKHGIDLDFLGIEQT